MKIGVGGWTASVDKCVTNKSTFAVEIDSLWVRKELLRGDGSEDFLPEVPEAAGREEGSDGRGSASSRLLVQSVILDLSLLEPVNEGGPEVVDDGGPATVVAAGGPNRCGVSISRVGKSGDKYIFAALGILIGEDWKEKGDESQSEEGGLRSGGVVGYERRSRGL